MAPIETIMTLFFSAQAAASVRVLILGLPRGISRIVSSIASIWWEVIRNTLIR